MNRSHGKYDAWITISIQAVNNGCAWMISELVTLPWHR